MIDLQWRGQVRESLDQTRTDQMTGPPEYAKEDLRCLGLLYLW